MRKSVALAAVALLSILGLLGALPAAIASAATGSTIFTDGFESGDFSAWNPGPTIAGDGTATVESTIVSGGSYAAELSESANSGSKAYLRESFPAQQDLTATGDFRILQQGASGGNVTLMRLLDSSGARLVSIYRPNGTSNGLWVTYGGAYYKTTGTIPLSTWENISVHVITNGVGSMVAVTLNGTQVYQSTSANLGTAGVATLQIGQDTAAQAYSLVADTISAQIPGSVTPPANDPSSPPTISGAAQQGQTLTASTGVWTGTQPISYSYQWLSCDSTGSNCSAMGGATQSTYTPSSADVGSTLEVTVTGTNSAGSAQATSAPTVLVTAAPSGLVALWHMDETTGTTMFDSIGSHNGTLHNIQLGLPGFLSTAYGFNGSTSYVDVPSASDLNPGSANITVTIHVQTTGTPPPSPKDWDLIRKGDYVKGSGEYKMELQSTGKASCGFEGTGGYSELIAGPAINDGQWHTVSCVKTATAIEVVVDGQVFSKAAKIGSISNASDVTIGSHPRSDWYRGQLDEASIQIG